MPETNTNGRSESKLDRWFSQPYKPLGTAVMAYLIFAMCICFFWAYGGMDNDSYYMIPQGQEIVTSGIPEYNTFTYHGSKTIVQQWLYCIGMYFADQVPNNLGLLAFMLIQALLVFRLLEKYIRRATKDPFWSYLAATVILLISCANYTASLRPENITTILLLFQCMVLDAYREKPDKKYLIALPVIMLAEANLHISLWPAHACIYAAYFIPAMFPWIQEKLQAKFPKFPSICPGLVEGDAMKPDPWLYGVSCLSVLTLFANPYGLDGFLYLFKSVKVFSIISMAEQLPPELISTTSVIVAASVIAIWLMLKKHVIRSTELCIAAGFLALACFNHHNDMFLPLALMSIVRPALRLLESKNPSKASDVMPNGVKSVLIIGLAVMACVTGVFTTNMVIEFKTMPGLDPVIEYVKENQTGNILNNMNAGPMLDYAGVRGLYGDTRPELLLNTIGQTDENPALVLGWLCTGVTPLEIKENYGSIDAYLDTKNIQFIIDTKGSPVMTYLAGWLEGTDKWHRVDIEVPDDAEKRYEVWERAE